MDVLACRILVFSFCKNERLPIDGILSNHAASFEQYDYFEFCIKIVFVLLSSGQVVFLFARVQLDLKFEDYLKQLERTHEFKWYLWPHLSLNGASRGLRWMGRSLAPREDPLVSQCKSLNRTHLRRALGPQLSKHSLRCLLVLLICF